MGIFSPTAKRNAYVPPSDGANSPTLLTGADPNQGGDEEHDKVTDPFKRKTLINGRVSDKWQEMMNYVANAMQKTGPSPKTGDLYAGGSSVRYEPGFRVAKAIQTPRYHDTKENP
jgi:hypothetical protein